ncbi:MAG: CHAT domain-containing protein [Bryobacteraceae bacterium]
MWLRLALLGVLLLTLKPIHPSIRPVASPSTDPDWAQQRLDLERLRRSHQFDAILQKTDVLEQQCRRRRDKQRLAWLLNVRGCAQFSLFRYAEALRSYLEAKRLALESGEWRLAASVCSNLSALYLQQNDLNAARVAARAAVQSLARGPDHPSRALIRMQSAVVEAKSGLLERAGRLFAEAVREAEQAGQPEAEALAWDQWGYELLRAGNLDAAEVALLEAYRIRVLRRSTAVASSYYTLGLLRLAQGRASDACGLLDRALDRLPGSGIALPLWRMHFERGRARRAVGRIAEAQEDYQRALELLGRLRLEVLPAESIWNASSVEHHGMYHDYVRNSVELSRNSRRGLYLAEALRAHAEAQAAGLRALISAPQQWLERLPDEYWKLLAELRAMEMEWGQEASPVRSARLEELQSRLTEMELEAGLAVDSQQTVTSSGADFVHRLRQSLPPDAALIVFHLAEPESYRWAVTRTGFDFRVLVSSGEILPAAERFRKSVQRGTAESLELGERLYELLFAALPQEVLDKRRWVLNVEDGLYLVPFSTLVTGRAEDRPVYLVESRSLELTPTPLMLLDKSEGRPEGGFVALADPVYNRADPRWRRQQGPGMLLAEIMPPAGRRITTDASLKELARLAASEQEAENCARAWAAAGGRAVLLRGWEATVSNLRAALAAGPQVVHLAAHFVPSAALPGQMLLALSLGPAARPELLGPDEISRWRYRLGIVVLSGCSSALGPVLPTEGLMGMTRAWMAAGAQSVVASLWPVKDDSGELFRAFYRRLTWARAKNQGGVAEALRQAQLEMIHSRNWRSHAEYWAAYLLAGKE